MFSSDNRITSVFIPGSVEKYHFSECEALKTITIGEGAVRIPDYAFSYCKSLQDLNLPDSVKSIGKEAFYGCENLNVSAISFPDGIETIGESTFDKCLGVPNILFNNSGTTLLSYSEDNTESEYTVPDSVKRISGYAFYRCRNLARVYLHDGIEYIGEGAFYMCLNLKNIELPKEISIINERTFRECESLKTIDIPSSVKSIEKEAFMNAKKLDCISLPEGLQKIGSDAFQCCESLICNGPCQDLSGGTRKLLAQADHILPDRRHLEAALNLSSPAFDHSDIRGFGLPLTNRPMVRHGPCSLKT